MIDWSKVETPLERVKRKHHEFVSSVHEAMHERAVLFVRWPEIRTETEST